MERMQLQEDKCRPGLMQLKDEASAVLGVHLPFSIHCLTVNQGIHHGSLEPVTRESNRVGSSLVILPSSRVSS
jgi:hypothetical protein